MKNLLVKLLLVVMTGFVLGAFQYGYPDMEPAFHNSWQSVVMGFALLMSILILIQEIAQRYKNRRSYCF